MEIRFLTSFYGIIQRIISGAFTLKSDDNKIRNKWRNVFEEQKRAQVLHAFLYTLELKPG